MSHSCVPDINSRIIITKENTMFHLIVGAAIVFFAGREALRYYRARLYKKRLAIWAESTMNPDIEKLCDLNALHPRHPDDPRGWGYDTSAEILSRSSRNE